MTNEEISWVEKAIVGDNDAFALIADRFQCIPYAIAKKMHLHEHDARDVVQMTLIHAWKKISGLKKADRFIRWLQRMAVHMVYKLFERMRPTPDSDMVDLFFDDSENPLDLAIRRESIFQVWEGLDRMKPLDRDTLIDFYIKGRSINQMGGHHTAIGTIKRRLYVARHRLRDILESVQ